ncbi:hypothetical protein ACFSQ7_06460 [Paenibacillus rhizoplanae]
MSGRKQRKFSVWISWSSIKKSFLGAVLLAVMIGIIAYDMPTARTVNYWSLPLSGKVIAIDAGHGGAGWRGGEPVRSD